MEAWSNEVARRQWERYEKFQAGTSEGTGLTSQQKEEAIRAAQSTIQKAEAQKQRREQEEGQTKKRCREEDNQSCERKHRRVEVESERHQNEYADCRNYIG